MRKILITGASGMIGKALCEELSKKGYKINAFSRTKPQSSSTIQYYKWNILKNEIDEEAFNGISAIIHLAGENIGKSRWTKKQKDKIITSRTDSIKLIYEKLKANTTHQIESVISSGAVGFYGDRGDELLTEKSIIGKGFLSETCKQWEDSVLTNYLPNSRTVVFRIGTVLNKSQGALPQMANLISLGLGSPLGSGKQWMPWIHLKDVIAAFIFALENNRMEGIYNMTAPQLLTNEFFTKALADQLRKPLWLPAIPSFILKGVLGEQSHLVLDSDRVSSEKLQSEGFIFEFADIKKALQDIYQ
jgi:uncharacterized protein (TIGR01777 family)